MTLHTVNLLPDHPDCQRCIGQLNTGDAVIFLGRGTWIASAGAAWYRAWQRDGVSLHVLEDDLVAAGLGQSCADGITPIDITAFVALTARHPRQRAWF